MICLLPNCAYLSETSRMLELHRALADRGADVRMATHGGTYEHLLDVPYDLIAPRMGGERCARFVRDGIGQGDRGQSMYDDAEMLAFARAEADYFRDHDVHVVVTGFTLTALLSSRLAGIPLVTEHAGSWVPPVWERGLLPAPRRTLPAWLLNRAAPRVRYYCAGFDRAAAELGVPGLPSMAALLLGDLTLVPEAPEVLGIPPEEMAAWRPGAAYRPETRLCYSGPLYARLDIPLPDPVAEFLDRPGPLVYVAVTSSPPGLVRSLVTGLASLDARILVAGTVHDLADLAGERVMVAGVLPSHVIMPRADLAVVSGGQGSVQTALASGTPFLGIPLQPEQDLNIALAARLGAARRAVRPARDAGRMLGDDRYRAAARRIHDVYAAIDGPGAAADAIVKV